MSFHELLFGFRQQTRLKHPEIFASSQKDYTGKRTVPMQVLSLGMPRTGTASMQAALAILGFETYHGFRAYVDINDYKLWLPAYEAKYLNKHSEECPGVDRAFFDRVIGHMNAVTDAPASSFALELIEAYPEAKVILVERDVGHWYTSFCNVFISAYESRLWAWMALLNPDKVGYLYSFVRQGVARCEFGAENAEQFRGKAKQVYQRHYEDIRRSIRDQRPTVTALLEYKLGSGWGPLCEFLGRDVPRGIPFPRVNESALMEEKIKVMMVKVVREYAQNHIKAGLVLGACCAIFLAAILYF